MQTTCIRTNKVHDISTRTVASLSHSSLEAPGPNKAQQPFHDPAIMSASFVATPQAPMNSIAYGPPPGLTFPPGLSTDNIMVNSHVSPIPPPDEGSAHGESNLPFAQGREVSVPTAALPQCGNAIIGINTLFNTLVARTQ